MADSDELAKLLAERSRPETNRAAIDARIHARFGRTLAVMFTDLVGFSRLVEAFGILHFLQLIQESETLFLPLIRQHAGTCLKREGDSLLAVFDTPRHALAAARAMVGATDRVNPGRAPEDRIEVCIGLGYGPVLFVDGEDVWGAEVNAASRLGEDIAGGGELLVTDAFRLALPDEPFVARGTLFGRRPIYGQPAGEYKQNRGSSHMVAAPDPTKGHSVIKFYYSMAPNPMKVALFLEESGLPYEPVPVDTRKGDQHTAAYKAINPNAKAPALVDGDVVVFDSNAILLYLAEKTGQFLPADTPAARAQMLSWLMFVASGIGPFSGQAVHFKHYAPQPVPYAANRYDFEAWRHWEILNTHLAHQHYMLGDTYTLVDMAFWGWARAVPFVLGAEAWEKLPNVKRLLDAINARPAAQRAEALKTRHVFKTEMDDAARKAMFPQNERLAN